MIHTEMIHNLTSSFTNIKKTEHVLNVTITQLEHKYHAFNNFSVDDKHMCKQFFEKLALKDNCLRHRSRTISPVTKFNQ